MINVTETQKYIDTLTGCFAVEHFTSKGMLTLRQDLRIRPIAHSKEEVMSDTLRVINFLGSVYSIHDAYDDDTVKIYQSCLKHNGKDEINIYDFIMKFELLFGRKVDFLLETDENKGCTKLIDFETKIDALDLLRTRLDKEKKTRKRKNRRDERP